MCLGRKEGFKLFLFGFYFWVGCDMFYKVCIFVVKLEKNE